MELGDDEMEAMLQEEARIAEEARIFAAEAEAEAAAAAAAAGNLSPPPTLAGPQMRLRRTAAFGGTYAGQDADARSDSSS